MAALEQCNTQAHHTVFAVVPCFMMLTLFIFSKMKKLEWKVKPPFTELVKKYGCFQTLSPGKKALVIWFLVKSL
jgi:hypothetical protein